MPRSESPPPYSQFVDDPFVDNPPAAAPSQPYGVQPASVPTQPYGAQPAQVDYRALHGYGPGIPAPEDIVPPAGKGKWHIVTKGTEIIITRNWYVPMVLFTFENSCIVGPLLRPERSVSPEGYINLRPVGKMRSTTTPIATVMG